MARRFVSLLLLLAGALCGRAATQCGVCHPKIAASYARTGMARSLYRPAARDSGRYYHAPSATWYSMEERGGRYVQRRWRVAADGQEIEEQESPVDYVMGSGNHVRTFLTRTERGALVELPLAWYAEKGGFWAMNPGHDGPVALRPRVVAYECMGCHNAYPQIPPGHDEPGSEPLYAGALPEGIDCQRCHGPGSEHERLAQSAGARPDAIRKAILNPSRLSRERRMEVCYQCHLETTSLPLPHSLPKYDRAPFSYNPAEPVDNALLFFDHAPGSPYEDDFEIAHSAYRLRRSKCFLSSQMTCTTCHDPHNIPRGNEAAAHYNGVCGQCHATGLRTLVAASRHTAAPDCVGCHMPKRRTVDVVNAVMTDHYIQRRPPAGDLLAARAERRDLAPYRGPVVPYYPAPFPATPENALYTAVAQRSARALAAEVARQKPAQAAFYVDLGEAWLGAGNPRNAVSALTEAVRRRPGSPVALLNLAEAYSRAGQSDQALATLRRGVEAAPGDSLLWYQLGLAHAAADRLPQAIEALRKATALDPLLGDAWNVLGTSLATGGDMAGAETAFRSALRAEPDHPDALGNLGHLLTATVRAGEAVDYFRLALRVKQDDAEVRINYAVTLAGLNRLDEAETQAREAVRLDPKSAEARDLLAKLQARRR